MYKRTAAAELHPSFCEPLARVSPIQRVDGVAKGSPLRRVHGASRVSAGGSRGEAHDERNIFAQVDELLDRVINLTSDIPTSGDRMRNIAGLFTPGKGRLKRRLMPLTTLTAGIFNSLICQFRMLGRHLSSSSIPRMRSVLGTSRKLRNL